VVLLFHTVPLDSTSHPSKRFCPENSARFEFDR
jgi:hypothetical protein